MNLDYYSVQAGAGLDYVPPISISEGIPNQASCIIVVRKRGKILSLKPKEVELPKVQIRTDESIRTASQAAMQRLFGFAAGRLELHGRFLPNKKLPPVFLLRYLPLKKELATLEGKEGPQWFSEVGLTLSKSILPISLLRLMANLNPGGEIGHDVCGKLCIWTKEVEERVRKGPLIDKAQKCLLLKALPAEMQERLAA